MESAVDVGSGCEPPPPKKQRVTNGHGLENGSSSVTEGERFLLQRREHIA